MNSTKKIGQATVRCIALGAGNNELDFTWVQFGRRFEPLVGLSLTYQASLPKSKIRLSDPAKGDQREGIIFEPLGRNEEMEDGREYAVLISWDPDSKDDPKILGFGSKKSFEVTAASVKDRKNTYIAQPERAPASPKSKFRLTVVQPPEDPNHYRVTTMRRVAAGKIGDIVTRMTHMIEDDPTDMLLLGTWEKKNPDNRYEPCAVPDIPPANEMLVNSYKKKKEA